jgi:putative ABC transport system ATP-binding protein
MSKFQDRAPAAPAICMEAVDFRWHGRHAFALSVGRLQIGREERVLLLGPSGAGKSTLLSLICGIVAPQAGRIEVLGRNIPDMGPHARDRFRAEHFGIIFQMFNLLPYASALDNVLLPLSFAPGRRARATRDRSAREEAERVLEALGIDGALAARGIAANLSVGQQQRVAAARALIGAPEIIIADEPTSALDTDTQARFLDLLFGQAGAAGATLLMVSHDERLAARFGRAVHLHDVVAMTAEAAA